MKSTFGNILIGQYLEHTECKVVFYNSQKLIFTKLDFSTLIGIAPQPAGLSSIFSFNIYVCFVGRP